MRVACAAALSVVAAATACSSQREGGCAACGPIAPGTELDCSREDCAVRCAPLRGDCDRDLARGVLGNGCETALDASAAHCGGCFEACPTACVGAQCTGQTPRCPLLEAGAVRPVGTALATDGQRFGLLFNDFVNGGLWLAGLGADGRPEAAPRRIADVRSHDRFAIAWDGEAWVAAWTQTLAGNTVAAQRFAPGTLAAAGAALKLDPPAQPWGLKLAARPGAVLVWLVTDSGGADNGVALLGPSGFGPLSPVRLEGAANQVVDVVATAAGFLAVYPAVGSGGARAPAVQALDPGGQLGPRQLLEPLAAPHAPPWRLGSDGVRAAAVGPAAQGAQWLRLSEGGAPERTDGGPLAVAHLAGGTAASLAIAGTHALVVVDEGGQLRGRLHGLESGAEVEVAVLPSMRSISLAASDAGVLAVWVRPRPGLEAATLEAAFVTGAGVSRPCVR